MEFVIETDHAPTTVRAARRTKTDLTPLLAAADKLPVGGDQWASAVGTSSMHTYRTRIQSGDMPEAPMGKYEVKVEQASEGVGTRGEEGHKAATFRLLIQRANTETSAKLIANAAKRAQRLGKDTDAPANPLG